MKVAWVILSLIFGIRSISHDLHPAPYYLNLNIETEMISTVSKVHKALMDLKKALIADYPELEEFINLGNRSFTCNEETCRAMGAGSKFSLGYCTAFVCTCDSKENPIILICKNSTMKYDATRDNCNYPSEVYACNVPNSSKYVSIN